MAIRQIDILKDLSSRINPAVNPYVAKLSAGMADGSLPVLQGSALSGCKGNWRQTFNRVNPQNNRQRENSKRKLLVEIGCHLGLTLNQMAKKHPETDFIGMDITFKRVVTAAERATMQGNHNILTVLGNARSIDAIFAPNEIDGFIIFFPDPWLKRSQSKHRLIDEEFARTLARHLAPGGFIWFKTDQSGYFGEAAEAFSSAGLIGSEQVDFFAGEVYESTFERRFRLQGLPSYSGHWTNPANDQMGDAQSGSKEMC
jgi:tRNA (guanine-N7-)-methyltransferase